RRGRLAREQAGGARRLARRRRDRPGRVVHPPHVGAPRRHRARRLRKAGVRDMPLRVTDEPTTDRSLAALLAQAADEGRPLVGAWSSLGSPVAAEILAGSGLDVVLVDGEHGPYDLTT